MFDVPYFFILLLYRMGVAPVGAYSNKFIEQLKKTYILDLLIMSINSRHFIDLSKASIHLEKPSDTFIF